MTKERTMTQETRIPRGDSFGKRLAYVRVERGLTQTEAAERCGIHKATWSYWEAHPHKEPRNLIDVVVRISHELNIDRDWLLWGEGDDPDVEPEAA